jgi:signal transduction histidine kinase
MICYLFQAPTYFLFSPDVPALLYYAHIPATLLALLVSFYVFWNGRHLLLNRLLLLIAVLFSFWTVMNLITWTNIHSDFILFIWSFFLLVSSLILIYCLYFIYVFLYKKDISIKLKMIFISLLAPIIVFAPTYFNLRGFNITSCDAFGFEQLPFEIYYMLLGVLVMVWIFILLIRQYRVAAPNFKKQIILMGTGIELFIFSFFGLEFVSSFLTRAGFLPESDLELYGLFGMVIFMVYISILIVRFGAFNAKLLATQALIWGVGILIGSQFFFIKTPVNFILNGVTFVGIIIVGYFLIKSVKKEVEQREHLEKLSKLLKESKDRIEETNVKLENANEKLKGLDKLKTEFLSLASHQLRSPLTAIKGYTSMLLDGDFGKVNAKQKEAIDRVFQSSNHLALTVEDLLNVAKIEQGGMVYNKVDFDMEKIVGDIAKDLSVTAEKKGLKLTFETDKKGPYNINGDLEKIRQVVLNFIDNSMKYTPKGSIVVKLSKDENAKKIIFAVSDTGMGIKPEIKDTLFNKFARGEGGKLNTSGSGLGLYLAKEIIEAHKGRVWAESEGENKGSTFSVELNAI